MERQEFVRRLSASLAEFDVLEPWLTESHGDEHYWDDVAEAVFDTVGQKRDRTTLVTALREALGNEFGSLKSDNGLFRDRLDERISRIVEQVTE